MPEQYRRFRLFSILLVVLFLSLLFSGQSVFSEENEEELLRAKVDDKFSSIKKHLDAVSQNQQKINAKNAEVKSELDSLGIWIRRG